MCQKAIEQRRAELSSEEFGLYHSPAVSTKLFDIGLAHAKEFHQVGAHSRREEACSHACGCVCGNPTHRFVPTNYGWERTDVPKESAWMI